MGLLIDSSVIIGLERRGDHFPRWAAAISDGPMTIASVTASELMMGIHRADSEERRLRRQSYIEGIIEEIPVLPFDLSVARTHARIWAELLSAGQMVPDRDLIIAATALAHGHDILTDNLRDFERVPGLTVHQPDWS